MSLLASKIIGVGSYVPPKIFKNQDLEKYMETSDEWIQTRTGIQQRHWVDFGEATATSDLALKASEAALANAGLAKTDLDMIILATCTPDHDIPGTACILQHKLGLSEIPCVDLRQACSGFLYALSIADSYIQIGKYKNILVVGAEVHSKALNVSTVGRDTAVLFGDGAGAVIVTKADHVGGASVADNAKNSNSKMSSQIFTVDLYAQGAFAKELWIQAPGSAFSGPRITKEMLDEGLQYPLMNGKVVFVNATRRMSESLKATIEKTGFQISDIDIFFFHQANMRINQKVAELMGLPESKVYSTIQKYGNTTAATIPLGMDDAYRAGILKPGMLVASAAFGAGFTWATSVWRQ